MCRPPAQLTAGVWGDTPQVLVSPRHSCRCLLPAKTPRDHQLSSPSVLSLKTRVKSWACWCLWLAHFPRAGLSFLDPFNLLFLPDLEQGHPEVLLLCPSPALGSDPEDPDTGLHWNGIRHTLWGLPLQALGPSPLSLLSFPRLQAIFASVSAAISPAVEIARVVPSTAQHAQGRPDRQRNRL